MGATRALLGKVRAHSRNGWRVLRRQSLFKWVFVGAFALCFELGLTVLFYDGFRFLNAFGGAGTLLIGRLFSLFFLGIGVMLMISSVVTSYSTIFRSDEIRFLMTKPFTTTHVVLYKFIEATGLSSWAFFFVIIPFISAYTWFEKASPLLPFWTLLFSIPFLFLFSAVGSIVVLVAVRWVPNGQNVRFIGIPVAIIGLIVAWHLSGRFDTETQSMQFNIARLVPGLRLASNPLMPSWWTSEGIMSLSHGRWIRGLMMWGLLASTAGFLTMVFEWVARHTYYDAWQRVVSGSSNRRRKPTMLVGLNQAMVHLAHDTRAIVMKDIRTFFRDPLQWSQALVFFGLLGIYFANLRSFNYHALPVAWRSAISFLNIFSVSAVLCSLGSRFVYPQLSLEGHGFWMLGLAPTSMRRILLTKFMTAAVCMVTVSVSLVALSTGMLNTSLAVRATAVLLTGAVSLTVCSLSTGLGAVFLDLDQRNPAAIVSGFGGTLNLVLSLAFMLITILPFAIIFHLHNTGKILASAMRTGLCCALLLLVVVTLTGVGVPLWLGLRSLTKRDF